MRHVRLVLALAIAFVAIGRPPTVAAVSALSEAVLRTALAFDAFLVGTPLSADVRARVVRVLDASAAAKGPA